MSVGNKFSHLKLNKEKDFELETSGYCFVQGLI
jgi:hypothetical protein